MRYIPNTDHGLDNTAGRSIRSFYRAILHKRAYPSLTWHRSTPGTISVEATTKPLAVTLWQAHNPKARDFRVETLGKVWTQQALNPTQNQNAWHCQTTVPAPDTGWTAYLLAFTFPDPVNANETFTLTSEVSVIPTTFPFQKSGLGNHQ